jgi:pyridoxine 5-phosphate synthase
MPRLGVNIDHIATLRQARRGTEPEPLIAARICEAAGADSIVVHLREDRRHIQDADLFHLKKAVKSRLNLEMSIAPEIVAIACKVKPDQATLVPEKREELTTEGGLDVLKNFIKVKEAVKKLSMTGIEVSLFIDPVKSQVNAARKVGAGTIELHTGRYAGARKKAAVSASFREVRQAAEYALNRGLTVNAGHGLDYNNVTRIAGIRGLDELNIGYSIVCRAVFVGLDRAVKEMKALL